MYNIVSDSEFVGFPKIGQYRNAIKELAHSARYRGKGEDGNPIFDNSSPLPTVNFTGTVKLHGTNASVCMRGDYMWPQSRKRVISVLFDNAGFAHFVNKHEQTFISMLMKVKAQHEVSDDDVVSIFGEWIGEGVQSGVALSQLSKRFVVFSARISSRDEHGTYQAREVEFKCLKDEDKDIYNILDYPTYSIDIDLNYPAKASNEMVELVDEVEKECPFGKAFGVSGIGEGIVWRADYKGKTYRFKTKGQKHSVSKVKKLAAVDPEVIKGIEEFVEYSVTENRLKQGLVVVFGDEEITTKRLGQFLMWVGADIVKEESDVLSSNGLTVKQVGKHISNKARKWFFLQT